MNRQQPPIRGLPNHRHHHCLLHQTPGRTSPRASSPWYGWPVVTHKVKSSYDEHDVENVEMVSTTCVEIMQSQLFHVISCYFMLFYVISCYIYIYVIYIWIMDFVPWICFVPNWINEASSPGPTFIVHPSSGVGLSASACGVIFGGSH
jgi:hypothetical protein